VHKLARSERDPDVRRTAADGLEEHEISRLHIVPIERASFAVLLTRFARENRAVLCEDPLHETAAVEAA
jgi:hypothetical protein